MGCLVAKLCNPSAPDSSVRYFWPISGVIIDASTNISKIQRRPSGVMYVYNGCLIYQSRCCNCSSSTESIEFNICDIKHVNHYNQFTSHLTEDSFPANIVDVIVQNGDSSTHVAFSTGHAEEISRELNEICLKHRQKPKIFQFNSVDVDGVEIDLP
ncbi:hypothetical protein QR680_001783 [Steinernema hermaphroditum]|uniref:Uncharacterized protein n=1 Tax=Steinernema hermaphroditum TaxID=289476 RepID=A0AA39H1X3_9BILA|nr:hypothetical protein QR680_001783 [Steinernema hermaphroditum]